jgi:hypothetical protein
MGSSMDTLLEIINGVKIVHHHDHDLKYTAEHLKGRAYYFDVETPNGSLTFHLVLQGRDGRVGKNSESTNVFYIGKGELFRNFNNVADTQLKNFISAVFLTEIRRVTSDNLIHFPKMNFIAQHGTPANGDDPFDNAALSRGIMDVRESTYLSLLDVVAEGDTVHWHKVGDNLSGASLVTRIRQGRIPGIDPRKYKAKSVKNPETGKYDVWVQYTTEPQEVEAPTDADALAQQAWERIEDRVKSLFIEEFKLLL